MRRTFYEFLMTKRHPGNSEEIAEFANNAFYDQSFPKQSTDFDEISKYLEENAGYLPSMDIFDKAFNEYTEQ